MKAKTLRIVATGLINDCDNYPASDKNKWFRTEDGGYYVQLGGESAKYQAVEIEDPQKLSIVKGILVEEKKWSYGLCRWRMVYGRILVNLSGAHCRLFWLDCTQCVVFITHSIRS